MPSLPDAGDALGALPAPPEPQTSYRYDVLPLDVATQVLNELTADLSSPPGTERPGSLGGEAAFVADSIVPAVDRLVKGAVSPSPPPGPALDAAVAPIAAAVAAVSAQQTVGTILRLLRPDPVRRTGPSVSRREREGLGAAGLQRSLPRPSLSPVSAVAQKTGVERRRQARAAAVGRPSEPRAPAPLPAAPTPLGLLGSPGGPERAPQPPSGLALLAVLLLALSCSAPGIARVVPVSHDRPRLRPRPRRPDKPG